MTPHSESNVGKGGGNATMSRVKDFTGLTSDSRKVRPGYLFAALSGSKTDGAHF
jgi:UDP-N-acetylmuramoyl-L-alanyl-D-glutamate--2,6-diaminopimelate ligase